MQPPPPPICEMAYAILPSPLLIGYKDRETSQTKRGAVETHHPYVLLVTPSPTYLIGSVRQFQAQWAIGEQGQREQDTHTLGFPSSGANMAWATLPRKVVKISLFAGRQPGTKSKAVSCGPGVEEQQQSFPVDLTNDSIPSGQARTFLGRRVGRG